MSAENILVSYLGPAGTFTEAALFALAHRGVLGGKEITPLPLSSPAEVIDAVRNGSADFAVSAIENFVDGPVTPTFDALDQGSHVQIFAETELEIAFSIMVRSGVQLSGVATLATHSVAYQQIKNWLSRNMPNVEFVPVSSNAAAAHLVAEGQVDAAAAPPRAAEIFGLDRIADDIADVPGAKTRFVAVRRTTTPPAPTGHDRTSVVFALPNLPGSLVRALDEFAIRGVDLARIESRPTRKKFGTYRFHLDIVGHIKEVVVAEALRALHMHAEHLVFLGSWPISVPPETAEDNGELHREIKRFNLANDWIQAVQNGEEVE